MSSIDEKTTPKAMEPTVETTVAASDPAPTFDPATELPKGWMYKVRKLGPWTLPWYASPQIQLLMVAFMCFLCPGMYNALSGMGGAGQLDTTVGDNASTALYSTFSVAAFFAGTFANRLGIRLTLSLGGFGYCLYAASLLCYNHTKNQGFVIFAGALLGVCAGLLWTAQGAIMMSYPPEDQKGRYISWFWVIFNLGAVIGGLIPLGQNIHTTTSGAVSDGTYVGFIVLMVIGAVLGFFLCDAGKVIRADGSHVILMKNPTWRSELWGLVETLQDDLYVLFLFPMFFSSNWFYTYHFNCINADHFNVRTRALNTVLYYLSQMLGSFIVGFALDLPQFSRPLKAKIAYVGLFVLTMVIWGGGYAWQKDADPRSVTSLKTYVGMDWEDSGYVGIMFLYMFYGAYDAIWQTCVYWYMGALSNNSRKAANYAGFYKGIQSAGSAITWAIDGQLKEGFTTQFATCWGLLAGSLVVAFPVIWNRIVPHTDVEQDLKFSDETIADVLPDAHPVKGEEQA